MSTRSGWPRFRLLISVLIAGGVILAWTLAAPQTGALSDAEFAGCINECSEPSQYFVSDNWVSNESDYAEVVDQLRQGVAAGSAYIGVGPEQNFSYLAAVQPSYAFIVDIRRDNQLQQLVFKYLFESCATPQAWLAALLSREVRPEWDSLAYPEWLAQLDRCPVSPAVSAGVLGGLQRRLAQLGVGVRRPEWRYLLRMQKAFADRGLSLRFEYHAPDPDQPVFPSLGEILLERDAQGNYANFLASRQSYGQLRRLQQENRVLPVVGDFGGRHALASISCWLRKRHLKLGLFYASNVEFYLMPKGLPHDKMENFVLNLGDMPTNSKTLLLRTHLSNLSGEPLAADRPVFVPRLQRLEEFVSAYLNGKLPSYAECMRKNDLLTSARR